MKKEKIILIVWIIAIIIISITADYFLQSYLRNYVFDKCPKELTINEFQECYMKLGFIVWFFMGNSFAPIALLLILLSWLYTKVMSKIQKKKNAS